MVIRRIRLFIWEVFDGPSAGTGFRIYGRGIGSDDCHQTRLSDETCKEITGWTTAVVDFSAPLGWRDRLPRYGTGTTCGLAGSLYRRQSARAVCSGDQDEAGAASRFGTDDSATASSRIRNRTLLTDRIDRCPGDAADFRSANDASAGARCHRRLSDVC